MATYNPDDIIGKTIYAVKRVNGYNLADVNSNPIYTFNPGAAVGVVFSYVSNPDGLYWQFRYNGKSYFVKHGQGLFNLTDLKNQGLQTEAEKAAEAAEAKKGPLDKIFDFGKKSATAIIIVLLGVYAYNNIKK
jgi:hypothetical protein